MPDRIDYTPADLSKWPSHVRPIVVAEFDRLGIDDRGRLYWDGKAVEVAKSLSLSWWQKAGAFVATLSAVAVAVVELLTFLGLSIPPNCP